MPRHEDDSLPSVHASIFLHYRGRNSLLAVLPQSDLVQSRADDHLYITARVTYYRQHQGLGCELVFMRYGQPGSLHPGYPPRQTKAIYHFYNYLRLTITLVVCEGCTGRRLCEGGLHPGCVVSGLHHGRLMTSGCSTGLCNSA